MLVCTSYALFLFAVYLHHGGRQTCAGAEVGRERDQICQRNQGREDGDGKLELNNYNMNTCSDKCKKIFLYLLHLTIYGAFCPINTYAHL